MAFKQKTNEKLAERNDGSMPNYKVIYFQCKSVLLGTDKGGIAPFSVGDTNFDKRRASAFVRGVKRNGTEYIKRNYPVLCEGTAVFQ
ncbi:MAG: hypothetical protein NTV88_06130 [Candidatus Micrarchaeota archaeon]|nr:hypothetical protein [Candidatus Micrarchaeota archaeon]